MAIDIEQWLDNLGLSKYADVFAENEIDLDAVGLLSEEDFKELGLPMGPRRKLLAAVDGIQSPTVSEKSEILDETILANNQGERRQVTALFADIAGFTRLSSGMDAEETHAMLNGFFAGVDQMVTRYGGSIDKHIGDAVMAVFGAPVAHTDDPERALRAALDIHEAVAQLNPPLEVHVGVASGQVVASSTGSAAHTEYTITGDSVNLAARLTDLAKSGETLVAASVQRALGERFRGVDLGEQVIKGLSEPVSVWRLDELSAEQSESGQKFVGRSRELGQFVAALEHCSEMGKGQTVIVRGEAGVGKSRLVEEFSNLAQAKEFAIHTGLILDFGTAKGQDAIGALVRGLLDIPRGSGKAMRAEAARRAVNSGWIPEERLVHLNDLLDLPQPPNLAGIHEAMDNATRNLGKQETLGDLIQTKSEATNLLVRIEDTHWADQVILAHLAHLVRAVQSIPVLLILTSRITGDKLDQNWRAGTEGAPLMAIDLSPLDSSEASDLAQYFGDLDEDVISACVERSGGNPLFLEQLLRNADELTAGNIPGTIQGIVQARLDALQTVDQGAIQAASVLGQRFTRAAVEALLESGKFDPDNLLKNVMIRPAGEDFHFAHAMIREGVYASMLRPRRAELHRRAANWFEEDDLVLFAEHLDKAEERGAAKAYFVAAKIETEANRYDLALRLVERALELNTEPDVRFDLTCLYGDLLRELGQVDESISAFKTALNDAEDDLQLCQANIGLAEGLRIKGRYDEGLECLFAAEAAGDAVGSAEHLSRIHWLKGNLHFPMGNIEQCMNSHETALRYGQETGSPEAQARALGGLADAHYLNGRMLSAGDAFERCVEFAKEVSLARIVCANLNMAALCKYYALEFDLGIEMLNEALELSMATSNYRSELLVRQHLSFIFYEIGLFDKALEEIRSAFEISQKNGVDLFKTSTLAYESQILWNIGNRTEAEEVSERAWTVCDEQKSYRFLGGWVLGAVALSASDHQRQNWAIEEGFSLLSGEVVSHNYLKFYRAVMEVALETQNWDLIDRACDALANYTQSEPLPWSEFYISRAQTLSGFHQDNNGDQVLKSLRKLKEKAEKFGIRASLPQIELALGNVAG